jgi:hypothetical protein
MAQANDSISVTPGTGATVATQLVGGKEYQTIIRANPNGSLIGDIPTYTIWSSTITATSNLVYCHLFNGAGSGKILKIRKVFLQPSQIATTAAAQTWRVQKTSALGTTGAVALTPRAHDSTDPALPAQITAQRSYTAGGTQSFIYFELPVDIEETRPGAAMLPFVNILPIDGERVTDYVLAEGEGMSIINLTGTSYSWSVVMVFSAE